jgi:hypothetical protein
MTGVPIIDTFGAALFGKMGGELYQSELAVTGWYYVVLVMQYLFGFVPGNVIDPTIFVYQPLIVFASALFGKILSEKSLGIYHFIEWGGDFNVSFISILNLLFTIGCVVVYQVLLNVSRWLAVGIAVVYMAIVMIITMLLLQKQTGEARKSKNLYSEDNIFPTVRAVREYVIYSFIGTAVLGCSVFVDLFPTLLSSFTDYAHVVSTAVGVLGLAIFTMILFLGYRKPWKDSTELIRLLFGAAVVANKNK